MSGRSSRNASPLLNRSNAKKPLKKSKLSANQIFNGEKSQEANPSANSKHESILDLALQNKSEIL